MQVINTNVMSLNAQRNLTANSMSLATSIQRLSSGLRINSAKDDAAGLAISERFTTQIRGLNQATRNANDGISLAQTAEGALGEVSNNLQRIRELAVQSRNATNSASDRLALDAEVQERIREINRVASQTEFNGLKLLDGSFTEQIFQVGANFGQTISLTEIAASTGAALGLEGGSLAQYTATGTTVQAGFGAGDLSINGRSVNASADALAIANAINDLNALYGATATNAQTGITFNNVIGAPGAPATPASTGPSGAFTTAVSNQVAAVAGATGASGAFTTATLGAGQTFTFALQTGVSGTPLQIFTQTNGVVTAADIDTALSANAAAITAAGYTVAGTAAAGTLNISRADGEDFAAVVTDPTNSGFTTNTFLDAGTYAANVVTAGTPTVPDNNFTLAVDGIIIYNEASSIGGTVTASELDAAMATFLANNTAYSSTGTFAAGTRAISRADGTNLDVTITSNFTSTPGAFANAAFTTLTTNGVAAAAPLAPTFTLTLDGSAVNLSAAGSDGTITAAEVATAISAVSGFSATAPTATTLNITKADGSNFTLAASGADQVNGVEGLNVGAVTTYRGRVAINSSIAVEIGGTTPGDAGLTAGAAAAGTTTYTVDNVNVRTVQNADIVLRVLDGALNAINGSRAQLGAVQNRFESVIANLRTTSENLTSSRSRIRDADFAAETAELTRNQILQQAGVAMLAQANQAPQNVLSLLR